jgi:hypothetical protein
MGFVLVIRPVDIGSLFNHDFAGLLMTEPNDARKPENRVKVFISPRLLLRRHRTTIAILLYVTTAFFEFPAPNDFVGRMCAGKHHRRIAHIALPVVVIIFAHLKQKMREVLS